jgi:trimethylamine--corrinoid protein Co-methyltransferase
MIPKIRPKIHLLEQALVDKIIQEAYQLLEQIGIFVENREARSLLEDAGMRVDDEDQRVFLTAALIDRCLDSTPEQITFYDRSGDLTYIVGGDHVHFDPGSAAVTILDQNTQKQRKASTEDLVRFVRLTDALPHFDFQSTGLISSDVPDLISDSYRLYIALCYCAKPVVTGTFRVESFVPMAEMLRAVRGSAPALEDKPLAIFDACPSPALKWSNLTTQSLIDAARAGIPSELISMGMTGATSPVTITGTLVQHVAENLSGLVICQLAQAGAPVIFGGSPSSFDMRKGTTPMGAIETMMIDAAYSQVAKHLRLPTHAYMGLSDSKLNDSQAGLESGIGSVLAVLAGINVISGPGMLDFESCQSLEKLVIDNEICGMSLRLVEGVEQRDDPLALSLFEGFGAATQFLSMPHTKRWYREEHLFPEIIDRETYDTWASAGEKDMAQRASERVEEILRQHPPNLVEPEVRGILAAIMSREAEQVGLASLPQLPHFT